MIVGALQLLLSAVMRLETSVINNSHFYAAQIAQFLRLVTIRAQSDVLWERKFVSFGSCDLK